MSQILNRNSNITISIQHSERKPNSSHFKAHLTDTANYIQPCSLFCLQSLKTATRNTDVKLLLSLREAFIIQYRGFKQQTCRSIMTSLNSLTHVVHAIYLCV